MKNLFTNFNKTLKAQVNHEVPAMAYLVRVSDGDTIVVQLDRRFYDTSIMRLRLKGCYAPENKTEEGKAATAYLKKLLPAGTPLVVTTYRQTYDRYEAVVLFEKDGTIQDLVTTIIQAGFATKEKEGLFV